MNTKTRFLKSRGGRQASEYHGETNFSRKRKESIIKEQEKREKDYEDKNIGWKRISDVEKKKQKESIEWNIDLSSLNKFNKI